MGWAARGRGAPEAAGLAGLDGSALQALRRLLIACADTKLLLGYHYGEWTFGTPVLEAAIANCSLAQAELGHVRLLHGLLKAHFGDDPDRLVEERAPGQFASVAFLDRPLPDWAALVAANCVVDLAISRLLYAMRASSFGPLASVADKLLDEERYHAHHGRGWLRSLGRRDADCRAALAARIQEALVSVREWLGPAGEPEDQLLVEAGFKAEPNTEIYRAVTDDLAEVAAACGMALAPVPEPAFAGWSAERRRADGTGPDDEILFHVRGSKNALFKLG